VLVLVVGETVRAANWGLDGYARQTTPQLSKLPVINFPDVTSCGTNTEVSLPCSSRPAGADHDQSRIVGQQNAPPCERHARATVHWRDNQSGRKGVCDGLPNDSVEPWGGGGRGGQAVPPTKACWSEDARERLAGRAARSLGAARAGQPRPSFRRYPRS
jgi:lipid A ethanolaminephosphotransferase